MEKICVITSFNNKYLNECSYKFLESYNMPFDLFIYSEENLNLNKYIIKNEHLKKLKLINLFNIDLEFKKFINDPGPNELMSKYNSSECNDKCEEYCFLHIGNKKCKSKDCNNPRKGFLHCLNHNPFNGEYENENENIKNIIKLTKKFSYKVFSIINCFYKYDYDYYIWIDADSIFKECMNYKAFIKIIKNESLNFILAYLKRVNTYLEAGFMIFNKKNDKTLLFLEKIRKLYISKNIYYMQQTHDAFIWNYFLHKFQLRNHIFLDLTDDYCNKNDKNGNINILDYTIIYKYISHIKGLKKLKN